MNPHSRQKFGDVRLCSRVKLFDAATGGGYRLRKFCDTLKVNAWATRQLAVHTTVGKAGLTNSPAGDGGPGRFRSAQLLGSEPWYVVGGVHPLSPVGLIKAASRDAGSLAAPSSLVLIAVDIDPYSKDALNAALKTTFGEISANLHDELLAEASAVASTIFNRLDGIQAARKALITAKQAMPALQQARDEAKGSYEDLANHPSKFAASLKDGYAKARDQAHQRYKNALVDLSKQQIALNAANSEKIKMQSYVDERWRDAGDLTLADIVEPDSQYEGTKKGRADFDRYTAMDAQAKARNLQRWKTAKSAVEYLARDSGSRVKYMEFRSSHDSEGQLKPLAAGRTRISGNDFF